MNEDYISKINIGNAVFDLKDAAAIQKSSIQDIDELNASSATIRQCATAFNQLLRAMKGQS